MSEPAPPAPVVAREEFRTDDPDAAYAYMDAAYGTHLRLEGMATGVTFRHARLAVGGLAVDQLLMPAVTWDVDPIDRLVVHTMHTGVLTDAAWTGGRYGPGTTAVVAAPGETFRGSLSGADYQVVSLTRELLAEVGGNDPEAGAAGAPVLTALPALQPAPAERWREVVEFLCLTLQHHALGSAPILVGSATRLVAATALSLLPRTEPAAPPADRADAHPAALRRALAHLEAYAHTDLSVADLARAAQVSVRSVQLAFRRHLGVTPGAYLRDHRLDLARRELLTADPALTTVAAVGARWGFAAPSHFAAHYRRRFGELPSRTLHAD